MLNEWSESRPSSSPGRSIAGVGIGVMLLVVADKPASAATGFLEYKRPVFSHWKFHSKLNRILLIQFEYSLHTYFTRFKLSLPSNNLPLTQLFLTPSQHALLFAYDHAHHAGTNELHQCSTQP